MRKGHPPKKGLGFVNPSRRLSPEQHQRRMNGVSKVGDVLAELAREERRRNLAKPGEAKVAPQVSPPVLSDEQGLEGGSDTPVCQGSPESLKILLYHCIPWEGSDSAEMRVVCLRLPEHLSSQGRDLCIPRYMETAPDKTNLDPMSFRSGFEVITRNLGYDKIGEYHVAAKMDNSVRGNRYAHIVHLGGEVGLTGFNQVLRNPNAARYSGHPIRSLTPAELSRGMIKVNLTAYRLVLLWLKEHGHDINGTVQRGIDSVEVR